MRKLLLLGLLLFVIQPACTGIGRSAASGYSTAGHVSANRDLGEVRVSDLARAERELEGRREREQYFTNRPYMRNEAERLEFLKLATFRERQKWLEAHGIRGGGVLHHNNGTQDLIDAGDIAVGMTMQAVRSSWGEPESVEAAGNPMYGNQRWYFTAQKSSPEGFVTQKRVVIFRDGRVAAWETR